MIISILLAILSGLLYVFSFAPWDHGSLQWIAFLPLLFAVHRIATNETARFIKTKIFFLGFILSFMIGAGGFYWVAYSVKEYGGLPDWVALLLLFVFCLVGQLQVPLYLLLRHGLQKRNFFTKNFYLWPLLSGLAYVGVESLYPKIFMDTAGAAFYKMPWARQAADIGGPFFLTALILMANEFLLKSILLKSMRAFTAAVAVVLVTLGYGAYRHQQVTSALESAKQGPTLKVAMIQANIGDFLKVAAERGGMNATRTVMDAYISLSTNAAQSADSPDAIVWPETAYPSLFGKPQSPPDREAEASLRMFAHKSGKEMIFGGYDQDEIGTEYNSMFFFNPNADRVEVYHKAVLLMFGETLPFADTFPSMKSWFPNMGFFGRGPGAKVFEVKNSKGESFSFAPSICYEGLFASHAVDSAHLNADVLMNVTNDSWFGPEGEPFLHLELTIFRSIETRTPMLRSTNTGVTTFINADGEMIEQTAVFQPQILRSDLNKRPDLTSPLMLIAPYLGADWFIRACQAAVGFFLILLFFHGRKAKANAAI